MALLLDRVGEPSGDVVPVRVARIDLWKRRWRGVAEDGREVAVALETPARNGDVLVGEGGSFRVEQESEEVVVIGMPANADLAAQIGWYFGNRHIPIEVRESEILAENFPTLTDSLERIGIAYTKREDILNCRPHSEDHRH
jgi:urease accessory protein UreE